MAIGEPRPGTAAPDRSLVAAKLRALVRGSENDVEVEVAEDARLAPGAAGAVGDSGAWVLLEHEPLAALGPALLWLRRSGHWGRGRIVVAERTDTATVALRLAGFDDPLRLFTVEQAELVEIAVPSVDEAAVRAGVATVFEPGEFLASLDAQHRATGESLVRAIQERHPHLAFEAADDGVVLAADGLEVARIVPVPAGIAFEVGVGAHDQDARRRVVGYHPVSTANLAANLTDLADALAVVERHRSDPTSAHPLRRLRPARRLRARVVTDPSLAGLDLATRLAPVADPQTAPSMRRDRPAVAEAAGESGDAPGDVVVCSTGVDLDLVPTAVHAWLRGVRTGQREPRLTIVVPERDAHVATRELVEAVHHRAGARLVTVAP